MIKVYQRIKAYNYWLVQSASSVIGSVRFVAQFCAWHWNNATDGSWLFWNFSTVHHNFTKVQIDIMA